MKNVIIVVFVALISFDLSGQSKGIDAEIRSIMKLYDAIGLSSVVVKNNRTVYSESFGFNPDYSHPDKRTPFTNNDVFWLASVSKTFISAAIMQLVEKKRIKLDDDINDYLSFRVRNPHYPDSPITVRMLLSHRSSLNDSQYGWTLDMFDNEDKRLEYSKNFNNYRPGTKYDYCNLGYTLLGAIIENVTEKRFDTYIDDKICKPLHLSGSYNLTKIDSSRVVRSYNFDSTQKAFKGSPSVYNYSYAERVLRDYRLGYSTGSLSPAGGMKISANDLARFMMTLMNGGRLGWRRILRKESVDEMKRPQGTDNDYGLALTTYSNIVAGQKLIGMRGGSHGVHSIMVFDPNGDFGFVLINNGYNTTAEKGSDMNYRVIRALYNCFIKE